MLKKGMKVVKVFHGINGYREAVLGTIGKVSKGVAYFANEEEIETGITYDPATGNELENFIPGMRSEVTPLEGNVGGWSCR